MGTGGLGVCGGCLGVGCLTTGALEIDVLCCNQRRVGQSKEPAKLQSQVSSDNCDFFADGEIIFQARFQETEGESTAQRSSSKRGMVTTFPPALCPIIENFSAQRLKIT